MPTSINWAVNSLNVNLFIKKNQQRSLLLVISLKYYGVNYTEFRNRFLVRNSYDHLEDLLKHNDNSSTWLPWDVFDHIEQISSDIRAHKVAKTYHDLSEKLLGGTDNGR